MSELLLGIDIGGTKIALTIADRAGSVIARTRRPTNPSGDPEADVRAVATDVRALIGGAGRATADLAAIGVSAPGPLDRTGRRLLAPPNLPGWTNVPLADWLEADLGCAVSVENDANASALAESRFGAGRGLQDFVYLTMSTGVGAGLILAGRLYRGHRGSAGEVGHARVAWDADGEKAALCGCGKRGCLEAYVGGAAWTRRLQTHTPAGSKMLELAGSADALRPEHVVAAAQAGDPFALREMARFNEYLARGIVNLAFTLAPQAIVLGTIPAAAGETLCLGPVRAKVQDALWEIIGEDLRILPGALGPELPYRAGLVVALAALEAEP